MNNFHEFCTNKKDWLTDELIGQYAEIYFQYLEDRKYATSTVRKYLSSIEHFSLWGKTKELKLHQVDESIVTEFLDRHLPDCCCIKPVYSVRNSIRPALGHLLIVLRAHGVIEPPTVSSQPVDIELRRYDRYMRDVQGLATKTRSTILLIVDRLLRSDFAMEKLTWQRLL